MARNKGEQVVPIFLDVELCFGITGSCEQTSPRTSSADSIHTGPLAISVFCAVHKTPWIFLPRPRTNARFHMGERGSSGTLGQCHRVIAFRGMIPFAWLGTGCFEICNPTAFPTLSKDSKPGTMLGMPSAVYTKCVLCQVTRNIAKVITFPIVIAREYHPVLQCLQ